MAISTIGQKLENSAGIAPGFDFLRVFLALSIVIFHEGAIVGFEGNIKHFFWFNQYWIVAIFFALSGFLVTGSAMRLPLGSFLVNRALRIIPALAVEVIVTAFIIGPLFTTLPLAEYFMQGQVYHYMTNMVGLINYDLPGVFKDNISPYQVNASLWTVPYEFGVYGVMSFLVVCKLLKRPLLIAVVAIALSILGVWLAIWDPFHINAPETLRRYHKLYEFCCGQGSRLFVLFLLGVASYLYRYRIVYDWRLFFLCIFFCITISSTDPTWTFLGEFPVMYPVLNLIASIPLTYIMLYLGVSKIPTLPIFHRGDYSYGIYLYGYAIQQAVAHMTHSDNYLLNLSLSIPLITIAAIFSWHVIEKPILKLRKRFSFVAKVRLNS